MEKKYQIFISSTYEDLKEERRKVQDTILSMYHFPIGMEMFSAADEEQWEIIKETIDSSDYYVLIIGHRYGSEIEKGEDKGISFTQKEFRYALKQKIPVLAFIIDNTVSITPEKFEQDAKKKKKLVKFIEEVTNGRTVQWWTSGEDLANKVMNSLNKQINRGKRPGWIRADAIADMAKTQNELVEMSRKIRSLENENEKLKKYVVERTPEISVQVNGSYEIKIQDIVDESILKCNTYVSKNQEIGENERLKTLIKKTEKNCMDFQVSCKNIGTTKANDINIDVCIPNELFIMYKTQKNKSEANGKNNSITNLLEYANISKSNVAVYSPYEIREKEEIIDNHLLIWLKDLIHTRSYITDKYYIGALKKGIFEIQINIICEEMLKNDIQFIKVIVE